MPPKSWHRVCIRKSVDEFVTQKRGVMKKMMMVLSLFASLSGWSQSEEEDDVKRSSKQEHTFQDLVGSWRTKGGSGLDIIDSNTVYIVKGNMRKLAVAKLSDINKAPASFNLTIKDSSKTVTLKGLIMLVADNLMQWQVFDSETKPVSYTSQTRGDMLFMKRIEKLMN